GKSSLLEAIFLFYDRDNATSFFRHLGWRGIEFTSTDAVTLLGPAFYGFQEDLCSSTVADHPIMPHVSQFIKNVKEEMQERAPKNESKATLQAFLSGMPETVSSVGLAALKGYWSFDHDGFSELRSFLQNLSDKEIH